MKQFEYFLAYDDGNQIIRHNRAEDISEYFIEKYDAKTKHWVHESVGGKPLCGIYSGDIPVRHLTEEQANDIIAKM